MILLILFLPVAIYLIWVGGISRHSRPSIVGGSWDFVALMFAGSGLVLVGLPAVITSIYETWRRYWLTGEGPIPYSSLEGSRWFWLFIWLVYFVIINFDLMSSNSISVPFSKLSANSNSSVNVSDLI